MDLWCTHSFKGIVHPKMKISRKCTELQAIRDVDEFFFIRNTFEDIKHYITCSPMDPLQWMVPPEWEYKTADKNITKMLISKSITIIISNPHHSSPSVNILWSEKLCLCKKQTHHLDVLTVNHFFQLILTKKQLHGIALNSGLFFEIKGIVHPKMKILSILTHPHVVSNP